MADHEIHITPHVNLTEIRDFERHLAGIQRQFDALIGSAQKITWPSGPGSASPAGSGSSPASAQPRTSTPNQAVNPGQSIPGAAAHDQQRRSQHPTGNNGAPGANLNTPGGLLDWMQGTYLPEAATIQEMLKGFGVSSGGQKSKSASQAKASPSAADFTHFAVWHKKPETPEEFSQMSHDILSLPNFSATQKKAAMDAAQKGPAALHEFVQQQQTASQSSGKSRRQAPTTQSIMKTMGLGSMADLLTMAPEALPLVAGAVATGYVTGQVKQGWTNYRTQGTAFSALSKSIGDLGQSFNTLRNTVNKSGMNFAETMGTITQAAQTYAPYVGNLGTKGLTQALTASQGFAFSYGLNPVSTTQAFGQAAQQIGITRTNSSAGQMTPAQWASLIANATSAGSMQGRVGQVLSSMLSVSQQIAQSIAQAPNQFQFLIGRL